MWNMLVPGIGETIYDYSMWFFTYSVLGWIVESIYMSLCNKKITNRGFVHGPICPIYGLGGTMIHMAVKSLYGHYVYMFIAGSLIATLFEFITANLMIKVFGFVWWDYTNKPFNFRGIICLESSIAWGFYTIMEALVLYKLVFLTIHMIPAMIGKIIIIALFFYYTVDFVYCLVKARRGDIESNKNNLLEYGMK